MISSIHEHVVVHSEDAKAEGKQTPATPYAIIPFHKNQITLLFLTDKENRVSKGANQMKAQGGHQ